MPKYKLLSALLSLFLLSFTFSNASASVMMLGTRVIYPADVKEKSLVFTNTGNDPVLLQVWTDINNPDSTAETADAPFLVMPPIFRINPTVKHNLRLKFTGADLPQDRESLFWLNFLQYPAKKESDKGKNSLILMIKSRVKILYRPSGLAGNANKSLDDVKVSLNGKNIEVKNASPWFISVANAFIEEGQRKNTVKSSEVIKPYSTAQWVMPSGAGKKLTINAINDYGGVFSKTYTLVQ
ncbi:molecular chaperone [Kosakonia sp. H02]|nr:molecular chaperone [Kosakonia sp. H02]